MLTRRSLLGVFAAAPFVPFSLRRSKFIETTAAEIPRYLGTNLIGGDPTRRMLVARGTDPKKQVYVGAGSLEASESIATYRWPGVASGTLLNPHGLASPAGSEIIFQDADGRLDNGNEQGFKAVIVAVIFPPGR